MKIECIIQRKGGSHIPMPGKTYHFAPQEDGRHIADVENESHIERFLSIREAYRIARTPGAAAVESDATASLRASGIDLQDNPPPVTLGQGETLSGSSSHPSSFDINGKTYSLGAIVMQAFKDSGVTVENWNEMTDEQRATKIDIVLDGIEDGEIEIEEPAATSTDNRAALAEQYKAKFGKRPPNTMSVDNIKAKLAEGAE